MYRLHVLAYEKADGPLRPIRAMAGCIYESLDSYSSAAVHFKLLNRAAKDMIRSLSLGSLHSAAARSDSLATYDALFAWAQPYGSESISSTTVPTAHDSHNNYDTR